jgi:hypothetical protein
LSRTKARERSPVAEVEGLGGRYVCSYRAREVWQDGRLMRTEPDGVTYAVAHPDTPEIVTMLSRRDLHELAFGRSIPGGGTVKRDGTVRGPDGVPLPVTTRPVGWSRHEMPAVKIGGELCLIQDLMKFAHGQGAVAIAPGRVPFNHYDEEN